MSILDLPRTIRDVRSTLQDWGDYKRQTGHWPVLTIVMRISLLLALFVAMFIVFRYVNNHTWSPSRREGYVILGAIILVIIWSWADNSVKLYEARNRKRLRKHLS